MSSIDPTNEPLPNEPAKSSADDLLTSLTELPAMSEEPAGAVTPDAIGDAPMAISVAADERLQTTSNPPGPGLPEAVVWTVGVLMVHVAATIVLLIGLSLQVVFSGQVANPTDPHELQAVIQDITTNRPWLILGFEQGVFFVVVIVATVMRLGGSWWRKLNTGPIDPLHFGLMIMLLFPMLVLSGSAYEVGLHYWNLVADAFPVLRQLDQLNTVEAMEGLVSGMSLPFLLLTIAVIPAISEELIFRGVVGRGLTARWGLPMGILLTSFLFAIVHGHPAHAAGVLPLGICIHLLYVTTRSFWAPVLFHFMNNAMATVAAKYGEAAGLDPAAAPDGQSPILIAAACISVALIVAMLWRTRVRHYTEDDQEWNPGYPTVERPPMPLRTHVGRRAAGFPLTVATVLSSIVFLAAGAVRVEPEMEPGDNQPMTSAMSTAR